jgi:hypothetical protein
VFTERFTVLVHSHFPSWWKLGHGGDCCHRSSGCVAMVEEEALSLGEEMRQKSDRGGVK